MITLLNVQAVTACWNDLDILFLEKNVYHMYIFSKKKKKDFRSSLPQKMLSENTPYHSSLCFV